MTLTITRLTDPSLLLELNNAAVPDINPLDDDRARWLTSRVVTPGLALLDGKPAGVIIVLSEQSGYDSDYFRWFAERYENFLYIDRVIVAEWARGRSVARRLYEEVDRIAQERRLAIVADVYSEPPNVPSLRLHHAMGFAEIGTQPFPAVRKVATKFMKHQEYARPKNT
jgi:uncharacterized protein